MSSSADRGGAVATAARHLIRLAVLAAVAVVAWAGPAGADPARPGDYSSRVTSVEPAVDGVSIEVTGGDAFVELSVDEGHEVVVDGYSGEPFLRVAGDGTVFLNRNSAATYLNDDRYADVALPERLQGDDGASLDPEWDEVAGGGRWAWHDHRVHWMAPDAPPSVPRGGTFDWSGTIGMVVDGTPVAVTGEITFHEAMSPLPWLALALVAAVAVVLGARVAGWAPSVVLAVVGVGAVVVAGVPYLSAPPGGGTSVVPVVVAVVGAVAALVAVVGPPRWRLPLVLAAVACLATWGALRFAVLTHPVLPTELPGLVDRGVTAAALGASLGAVAQVLARPAGRRTGGAATAG